MRDLDKHRKVLVGAILDATGDLHFGTLSQLIRNIPSKVWDWDLFDEAVQRAEVLFDGITIVDPKHMAYKDHAMTSAIIESHRGDYLRLAQVAMFFREPMIRLLPADSAIEAFMHVHKYSMTDAVEVICAYATETAQNDPDLGVFETEQRRNYLINELFGVNILPEPYHQMLLEQLVLPTRNVEQRKLEENVKLAEQRLADAKTALENFKG